MNSRSCVSIAAFSMESAARNRCSKLLPVRMFLSLACTIARRLPAVWWRHSTTRHGSPSKTRTIPRRICVAGIAIRQILGKTYIAFKGSDQGLVQATGHWWDGSIPATFSQDVENPLPAPTSLRKRHSRRRNLKRRSINEVHDHDECTTRDRRLPDKRLVARRLQGAYRVHARF